MIRWTAQAGLVVALSAAGPASAVPAFECAGDPAASHALVYLHGVDPPEPTAQERGNRTLLSKLAKSEGFALAMARATVRCTQPAFKGKLCWPRGSDADVEAEMSRILKGAARCHKKGATLGMVAFSNGGFFVNRVVQQCLSSPVRWFLSIGSGGAGKGGPAGKQKCGHLHLMIGRKDVTNPSARRLHRELQALGRSVELTEFDGGHVIPEEPTRAALRAFKKRPVGS